MNFEMNKTKTLIVKPAFDVFYLYNTILLQVFRVSQNKNRGQHRHEIGMIKITNEGSMGTKISFSRPPPPLRCLAKSSNSACAHWVVGKCEPFRPFEIVCIYQPPNAHVRILL
jgi:hypothetical protein